MGYKFDNDYPTLKLDLHIHVKNTIKLSAERLNILNIWEEQADPKQRLTYMSSYVYDREPMLIGSLYEHVTSTRIPNIEINMTTSLKTQSHTVFDYVFTLLWLKTIYSNNIIKSKTLDNYFVILDKLWEAITNESELQ